MVDEKLILGYNRYMVARACAHEKEILMLKLIDIVKTYGEGENAVNALKGINLSFPEYGVTSILGASGCGKTTLLNIIGGLDKYTSGDLRIDNVSTSNFKSADWDTYRNHNVGFVFQNYYLIPHLSVLENVMLALDLTGISADEQKRRAKDALQKVGLEDQLKKNLNNYRADKHSA